MNDDENSNNHENNPDQIANNDPFDKEIKRRRPGMTNKALAPLPEYVSQDSSFDNLQGKDHDNKSKYVGPAFQHASF